MLRRLVDRQLRLLDQALEQALHVGGEEFPHLDRGIARPIIVVQELFKRERFGDIHIDTEGPDDLAVVVAQELRGGAQDLSGIGPGDVIVSVPVFGVPTQDLQPQIVSAVANLAAGDVAVADVDDCVVIVLCQVVQHNFAVAPILGLQHRQQVPPEG